MRSKTQSLTLQLKKMYRYDGNTGLSAKLYICKKDKWKYYLMKLLSTKDIDDKIRELNKKKKAMGS